MDLLLEFQIISYEVGTDLIYDLENICTFLDFCSKQYLINEPLLKHIFFIVCDRAYQTVASEGQDKELPAIDPKVYTLLGEFAESINDLVESKILRVMSPLLYYFTGVILKSVRSELLMTGCIVETLDDLLDQISEIEDGYISQLITASEDNS